MRSKKSKKKKHIKERTIAVMILTTTIICLILLFNMLLNRMDILYINKKYNNYDYPYFNNIKIDKEINNYISKINKKNDKVKYQVNYVDDYVSLLFKTYKNNNITSFKSMIFKSDYTKTSINEVFESEDLINQINIYCLNNNINLSNDIDINNLEYLLNDNDIEIIMKENNDFIKLKIDYNQFDSKINLKYRKNENYNKMTTQTTTTKKVYDKVIAFSFDDGPSKYTPQILDILEQYGAKATFFEVGYMIKSKPDIVLDVYNRGFEIGNHTMDHSKLTKLNFDQIKNKIDSNNEAFQAITNDNMRLVRPPYGSTNDLVVSAINYPIIKWSVDSRDWESKNVKKIVPLVEKETKDGDIVLFHDLYESTLESIKILVPYFYENGYEIVSVSKLFEIKGIPLENNKIYRYAR